MDDRRAKVNDLDLIEIHVRLEEDVLWLHVPMNNVRPMAIVYTLQNLLHKNRRVSFSKVASSRHLIEQLTAFTDPNQVKWSQLFAHELQRAYLLSDDIKPLIILKEFVHLDNVWMILHRARLVRADYVFCIKNVCLQFLSAR